MFPSERIGNEYYGDGGMRMLTPLSPAIHLGADRVLVISTRDEKPDPAPDRLLIQKGYNLPFCILDVATGKARSSA